MSSKFLVGVGAWLLGAAAATTGSMVAVGQLAHSLLDSPTQQLVGTTSGELNPAGSVSPTPTPTGSASPTPSAASSSPTVSSGAPAGGTGQQTSAPTLLTSADGTVLADCQPGGAYLVYWSPAQGYSADDVHRGPAQVASVAFTNQAGGLVMRVSCSSGTPVSHVYPITPESPEPSASTSDE